MTPICMRRLEANGVPSPVRANGTRRARRLQRWFVNAMSIPTEITPGTKVETGNTGTPSHKTGLVVGITDAETLGRDEAEPSALIAWESGEQEWTELSALRVAK